MRAPSQLGRAREMLLFRQCDKAAQLTDEHRLGWSRLFWSGSACVFQVIERGSAIVLLP